MIARLLRVVAVMGMLFHSVTSGSTNNGDNTIAHGSHAPLRPSRSRLRVNTATRPLPDSPLYIITPCSRPDYLHAARSTLKDEYAWVWIIVYAVKPRAWAFKTHPRIHEVWPTGDLNVADLAATRFGNPQRNVGLDLVTSPHSFVYFLDDDNGMHPAFWQKIYPLLFSPSTQYDFITFDQEREPERRLLGPVAKWLHIDTAMFVTQRALIGDVRWTSEYYADGLFAEAMAARSRHRTYVECLCSYYNFLKQNFSAQPLTIAAVTDTKVA